MKRIVAFFMLIVYSLSAIELTFSMHYCGKHFKYVSFSADTEKDCCGDNEHKTHCCKDKVVNIKCKDCHVAQVKMLPALCYVATVPEQYKWQIYTWRINDTASLAISCDSSPPFVRPVPIYISYRVFRI